MHTQLTCAHISTQSYTCIHAQSHTQSTHVYTLTCTQAPSCTLMHTYTHPHTHAHTSTLGPTIDPARPLREAVGSPRNVTVTASATAPSWPLGFWQLGWYFSNHFVFYWTKKKNVPVIVQYAVPPPASSAKMHSKKENTIAYIMINRSKRFQSILP